jgi:hypothetical protein
MITFISKYADKCTWLVHIFTYLSTFLLTKHFIDYDNVFLKDYSYSKSAVCPAPGILQSLSKSFS